MFQFAIHKIWNKKWLNLGLLTGIVLLVTFFACHPMLQDGAGSRLLQSSFVQYAKDSNEYPAVMSRSGVLSISDVDSIQAVINRMDQYEDKWMEYVDIDKVISEQIVSLGNVKTVSDIGNSTRHLDINYIDSIESHIEIVKGSNLSQADGDEDNTVPCIISEAVMDYYGLVVGEHLTMESENSSDPDQDIKFVITGVFKESEKSNNFWYKDYRDFDKSLYVDGSTVDAFIKEKLFDEVEFHDYLLLDYTQINSSNALEYLDYIEQFRKNDSAFAYNFSDILDNYDKEQTNINMIMWVLELPCIVLLLFFIYMVSSQIIATEEGEIAVLRSRGVKRLKIVILYLQQFALISIASVLVGIPLGYLAGKISASANAFLVFSKKDVSMYTFTWKMITYSLLGAIIAVAVMIIPVFFKSRMTIVEQKSTKKYNNSRPFLEKYFIDVILLFITVYLLFNFNKQKDSMSINIINGKSQDPILFLDASLFIFACGLVFRRLFHYLIILIDVIGKKHWKPALYVSFLQIRRTFNKQGAIAIFIIFTIASGVFNANMARTINENNEERIAYDTGADAIIGGKWNLSVEHDVQGAPYWYYNEPYDYEKNVGLVKEGICDSVTRVIEDSNVLVTSGSSSISKVQLMAISTKEFGETARLSKNYSDDVNDVHWFNALNALAIDPDGAILSRNTARKLGVNVGDTVTYTRYNPIYGFEDEEINTVTVNVSAIIDAFPGYDSYYYEEDERGSILQMENNLIVTNYAMVVSNFGLTPYSVWVRQAKGRTTDDVISYLDDQTIPYFNISSTSKLIDDSRNAAMIQITNGLFSISFIISIVICLTGFLIYWIMSIKKRELMFGIYRAMGMRMSEINRMLINEHVFSSLLSLLAGISVGILSTALYTKLLAIAYLPKTHNLPIEVYIYISDLSKLSIIVFVALIICVLVLRRILAKMNIVNALKLGED